MSVQVDAPKLKENITKKVKLGSIESIIRKLLKSKTGTVGFLIVAVVTFVALFAPVLAPYNPAETNISNQMVPPVWMEGGATSHILGTDALGRDILSKILYGSQISLLVGILTVLLAGSIGVTFGLVSGYYGGFIDKVIMRFVDAFLAIPGILFALIILAIIGPSPLTIVLVLGITQWVIYARMVRGETLSIKERDYVRSAKAIGATDFRIILHYILPNAFSSIIVVATLNVATTILMEASLSFLGLGVQPPDVSWGLMLSDGKDYLATSWWLATFPGIAISITVLGIIFLGDWLRDILDPRLKIKKG